MRTTLLISAVLLNLICYSQTDNVGKTEIINDVRLSTRIEIPISDDPFYINLDQDETKDFSILSGTSESPYSILVDVLTNNSEIFEGVEVNVDNAYFIGNSGGILFYDIYFDLTAVTGYPGGTYPVKIVTLFLNESSDVIGSYERENVSLTINNSNFITTDVVIYKFSNPPIIDGVIDPVWSCVDPNTVEFEPLSNILPPSIENATWKMSFTDDAFYILLEVDDDEFCDQWCSGFSDLQSDRAEIFFDVYTENLRDGRGANYTENNGPWYGHYQFATSWIESMESYNISGALQYPKNVPYDFGYVRDEGSWVYEMLIPFSSLAIDSIEDAKGPFMAEDSLQIGFCVKIVDTDLSDGLDNGLPILKILSWTDSDCRTSMDNAGVVELSTEIVDEGFEYPASITSIIETNNIFIYPNPATDFITLNIRNKVADIKIYDMLGNVVLAKNNLSLNGKIDISSLSNGMFFLKTDELLVVFAKQ